jgi:hypothetical protein
MTRRTILGDTDSVLTDMFPMHGVIDLYPGSMSHIQVACEAISLHRGYSLVRPEECILLLIVIVIHEVALGASTQKVCISICEHAHLRSRTYESRI